MQLTPHKEGMIKLHPNDEPPKAEEHQAMKDYQEHLKYTVSKAKKIMSKIRHKQQVYAHSIGKSHYIKHMVGKHKHHI